ncbi:M23 family metallopeptidase [Phenylobacterium sp.]|jgi:hypothetical protein|uniref:M23 family metallopeptidase n=1 Tax=Phenylobacterium sp. TaxID=1871053 RepID=UPI0037852944
MRHLPIALSVAVAACSQEPAPAKAQSAPAQAVQPIASGAAGPQLSLPLACTIGVDCEVQSYQDADPGPAVQDYRCGRRTYAEHGGIDFRIPDMAAQRRGVDVLAVAAGRVARLRDGVQDISIRDPAAPPLAGQDCGNGVVIDHGGGWETQVCHVARGSVRVKVGDQVTTGQPIAKVGLSGNTEFAHVHLSVRRDGQRVDPFAPQPRAPGACAPQPTLWAPAVARQLGYKAGAILNAGFAAGPVQAADVEAGGIARPTAAAPYFVAYARAIGLEGGDELELSLTAPDGAVLATNRSKPMDRDKAQYFAFVGKKQPAGGWPAGRYSAVTRIHRAGKVAAERRFEMAL